MHSNFAKNSLSQVSQATMSCFSKIFTNFFPPMPKSITACTNEIGVCKPNYQNRIEQEPIKRRKSVPKTVWNWQFKKKNQTFELEFTRNLVSRSMKNWTSNGNNLKISKSKFEQLLRFQPNPEMPVTYTSSTLCWSWHTIADSCRCRWEIRLEYTGSLEKFACYQTPETKWGGGCFELFRAYQTSPYSDQVTKYNLVDKIYIF